MANIQYFWKTPDVAERFATGISLHGHTLYSHESLRFIAEQSKKNSLLRCALHYHEKRCTELKPDFSRGYWVPPLGPLGAFETEMDQIEKGLGLKGVVSLTDHNTIEAPMRLQLLEKTRNAPISLEWTVPFEAAKIHLGIHNLPGSFAQRWVSDMRAYTNGTDGYVLQDMLADLHQIEDVLVVLNHPMWDICNLGMQAHAKSLARFLKIHNQFLHAFELGGLRSWNENQRVIDLANVWSQNLVSGGDRHGCEPSAVLNLTNASTFSEFAQEIRLDRCSNIVFMPQYQQSLAMRVIHTVNDVTRFIPEHAFGPRWDDRTFHPDIAGQMQPLSALWPEPPKFIHVVLEALRIFEAEPIKAVIQYVWGGSRNALRSRPLGEDGEAA